MTSTAPGGDPVPSKPERSGARDEALCPHCGAVLDLQRAVEEDRAILSRSPRPALLPRVGREADEA